MKVTVNDLWIGFSKKYSINGNTDMKVDLAGLEYHPLNGDREQECVGPAGFEPATKRL
jgi:hypothetical protein